MAQGVRHGSAKEGEIEAIVGLGKDGCGNLKDEIGAWQEGKMFRKMKGKSQSGAGY